MQPMIQKILDQAPDAILVANGEGTILYANRHVEKVFGYAPHELMGQSLNILIHPDLWQAHDRHLERLRNTDQASIFGLRREVFAVHRDGRELVLELHVSPLIGESEPLYIATVSDIMARKQSEFQREVLADQLATQNKKLQQILEATAATNQIHRELVAFLEREVRSLLDLLPGSSNLGEDDGLSTDRCEVQFTFCQTRQKLEMLLERIAEVHHAKRRPHLESPPPREPRTIGEISPNEGKEKSPLGQNAKGCHAWGSPLHPTGDHHGRDSVLEAVELAG